MNGDKCKPAVAFLEEASGSSGGGGGDGDGDDDGGELPIADMSIFDEFELELDALAPGSQVRVYTDQMETTRTPARPPRRPVRRVSVSSSTPPRPRPGRSALLSWFFLPGNYPESLLLPATAADDFVKRFYELRL